MTPSDEDLRAFLAALFDHAMDRSTDDLVDVERACALVESIMEAGTADRVGVAWRRWVIPARERILAAHAGSARLLRAWLPASAVTALTQLVAAPVSPPREWVEDLVQSPRFRAEVKTLLEQSLRELSGELLGGGKSVLGGVIGSFARTGAKMGKNLLGNLGLEERLAEVVAAAIGRLETRMVQLATDARSAQRFGELRRKLLVNLLGRSEAEAARFVGDAPHGVFDALIPESIAHNLARAEVRAVVLGEVRGTLAALGQQKLGALLDELGVRAIARDGFLDLALPLARSFVVSTAFDPWRGQPAR